ncbi:MAG: hypothetical protein MZW92_69255 [Comamonadaceae bacterium]|nr:hypothetical protein [Comamonadaceae bacterium]
MLDNVAHRRAPARAPGLLKGVLTGAWRLDRARGSARARRGGAADRARRPGRPHVRRRRQRCRSASSASLEIARALCADPCLLLLDEPAAGLRYLEKRALAELLRQLKAEGMSGAAGRARHGLRDGRWPTASW